VPDDCSEGALMPAFIVYAACLTLTVTDFFARAWRIRLLMAALGAEMRTLDAIAMTALGDAAASLSPMRAAGEPARLLAARQAGTPVATALVALGLEALLTYGVALPGGIALAALYGGEWSSGIRWPRIRGVVMWSLISVAVLCVAALVVVAVHEARFGAVKRWFAALREAIADLAKLPHRLMTGLLMLSVVSFVARVAILPLLTGLVASPPSIGVATLASFTLLYGQIVVPTPSGAGAVDVAFLGGAAGVSAHAPRLLALWRTFTTVLGTVVGLVLGGVVYGRSILSLLPFRR
jgi:uncharacterized membrane protein YbhN (UPF0104 family)